MNEIVTVIDIETTGLDPQNDHITEIAAIRAEVGPGGYIREIGRFQTYVALPYRKSIPEEITKLTGIKDDDLYGGAAIHNAYLALCNFIRGSRVVAHNAPFDFSFLASCTREGFVPRSFACTRAMTRVLDPKESASLASTCLRYGTPLNGHHRAMNDVEATLKLYAILRDRAEATEFDYSCVVVDSEERPLTFIPIGARVIKAAKTKEAV
ncbi:3'-5' exonuclease [Paenibacillus sp. ACRRY]|uniref:3'-5' exonuclease n=1 Tax=Paenibacillus sp. ACRRY TaxID=2918208 RepID=UPI001EF6B5C3|nr:3'-5' exonuclease [Paenibacillus sp. ACRRY]MCG7383356.1 3'-5' exonuclease [Paenibacillus sp. ACRRY]